MKVLQAIARRSLNSEPRLIVELKPEVTGGRDSGWVLRALQGTLTVADYDRNHNGEVERWEEVLADFEAARLRAALDEDKDGRVEAGELARHGRMGYDANGNGKLDEGERVLHPEWYPEEFARTELGQAKVKRVYATEKVDEALVEADVRALKAAFDVTGFLGFGATDEDAINRILCHRSNLHLAAVMARYEEKYGQSLRAAISDETSGDYELGLLKLLDLRRETEPAFTFEHEREAAARAEEDAKALWAAINDAPWWWPSKPEVKVNVPDVKVNLTEEFGWRPGGFNTTVTIDHDLFLMIGGGTDEEAVFNLLTRMSPTQLKRTAEAYERLFGRSLAEDLDGDFDGDSWDLIQEILKGPQPPAGPRPPAENPVGAIARVRRLVDGTVHDIGEVKLRSGEVARYVDLNKDGAYTEGVDGLLVNPEGGYTLDGRDLEQGDHEALQLEIGGQRYGLDDVPVAFGNWASDRRLELFLDADGAWRTRSFAR